MFTYRSTAPGYLGSTTWGAVPQGHRTSYLNWLDQDHNLPALILHTGRAGTAGPLRGLRSPDESLRHPSPRWTSPRAGHQRIFLLLSLQYDALRKPLPDPLWWLAGHPPALEQFSLGFAAYLSQLMTDMEKNEKEDNRGEIMDDGPK